MIYPQTCAECGTIWDAGPAWKEGCATTCPACYWKGRYEAVSAMMESERVTQRQLLEALQRAKRAVIYEAANWMRLDGPHRAKEGGTDGP